MRSGRTRRHDFFLLKSKYLNREGAKRSRRTLRKSCKCSDAFRGAPSFTMKIEAITLREIQMPLVHFFETSFGRIYSRRILLVTVEGEGLRGWGECVAGEDPFYSSEWIESAWP